jgi:hypothetical protein
MSGIYMSQEADLREEPNICNTTPFAIHNLRDRELGAERVDVRRLTSVSEGPKMLCHSLTRSGFEIRTWSQTSCQMVGSFEPGQHPAGLRQRCAKYFDFVDTARDRIVAGDNSCIAAHATKNTAL